jgi:hypothetical protein
MGDRRGRYAFESVATFAWYNFGFCYAVGDFNAFLRRVIFNNIIKFFKRNHE